MKKFVVLLVVVAITCISSIAFAAAEVTVGGSIELRSRDFSNLLALPSNDVPSQFFPDKAKAGDPISAKDAAEVNDQRDTQTRIRLDVNAKAGDVKGKVELESDFVTWGHLENYNTGSSSNIGFREAWISFPLPVIPISVTGGHQLLALGNAWFFRSMHFGTDAWVVANQTGNNTAAFVDLKVNEGLTSQSDDFDAYAFLDVFKLADKMTVGADITLVRDRRAALSSTTAISTTNPNANSAFGRTLDLTAGTNDPFKKIELNNFSVNFNGAVGPVNLKAQADIQTGKASTSNLAFKTNSTGATEFIAGDLKFRGNQVVLQGNVALEPVTVNFTAARGTGVKPGDVGKFKQYITILDIDPHYTFLYEYKVPTAALNVVSQKPTDDSLHTGFANTTAFNAGASVAPTSSLTLGADLWILRATQAVAIHGAVDPILHTAVTSKDVGLEVDVKVNWKLSDNLAWNWVLGIMKPGDAYRTNDPVTGLLKDADNITGIQGILAYKF